MHKKVIFVYALTLLCLYAKPVFSSDKETKYLCQLGITFYRTGRFDEALKEFHQVLRLDPNNMLAKDYINSIFKQEVYAQTRTRKDAISQALNNFRKEDMEKKSEKIEQAKAGIKISGEAQASIGASPQDNVIANRADFDLNEENWRTLSADGYNRRVNTFDMRVYDRLRVNLDSIAKEGFGFHGNIAIDPWSYIGKSDRVTITGVNALTDTAQVELFAWGNTNYTVSHNIYTKQRGDSFSLGESKVTNSDVVLKSITSINGNIFTIPESKIEYQFLPLRELWVDYKQEGINLRFFPIAYQNQALASDDPLRLSNNHIWWEESPWLDSWLPGNFNSSLNDFTKGLWDDALSYRSRDSNGVFLTALRGLSFSYQQDKTNSFSTALASPKTLWQDYDAFDSFCSATRLKHLLRDNFNLGSTYTFRMGLNPENQNKKDVISHVMGIDLGYEIFDGLKMFSEVAQSFSERDSSSPDYATKSRGKAYYFSLVSRMPGIGIMDLNSYDEIKQEVGENFFNKARLFFAHMDKGFDPTLSTYRETRDDAFWSRHIQFRRPMEYYYSGLYYPNLKWEDIEPYRIGNGIDINRDVIGFRLESSLWDKKLENFFDIRNVRYTNGKYIESVSRNETAVHPTDKLTLKLLGIYQDMPKTKVGYDPFIVDKITDNYTLNTAIANGNDPSLKTGSLGLEYAFGQRWSINGVWERTNDYTMAYDNFPRGNLTSSTFVSYSGYDKAYRRLDNYLTSQNLFPLPPYSFYDIFKSGIRLVPLEKLEIYLDYTRNEFKSAGQIDDNINHIGFEASYLPTKKLGLHLRYTYSRWNDLTLMTQGYSDYYLGHHNVCGELRYLPSLDDELVVQYGELGQSSIATLKFDPFAGAVPTLDTQHIFRLYYRRRF